MHQPHRTIRKPLAAIASCLAAFSFSSGSAFAGSVYDELAERERFSSLVAAIDAAGLKDALSDESASITIFAPNNTAFGAISPPPAEALVDILTYHVVGEKIGFRSLESGPLGTLQGSDLQLDVHRYGWWWRTVDVNDARVIRGDLRADNGVIHEINGVLTPGFVKPPTLLGIAAGDPENFSTLAELVEIAGFTRALDSKYLNLTLFAPTNAAFDALPEGTVDALKDDVPQLRKVLLNHLLYGEKASGDLSNGTVLSLARLPLEVAISENPDGTPSVSINGANVVLADVDASNGIAHVIDSVLVPEPPKSLTDVVVEEEELSTLEIAVVTAGLADDFDSTRSYPKYTIFAPNNAAFAALPPGAVDGLLAEPETLAGVLQFHVVRGEYTAAHLRDGQRLRTLSGDYLEISVGELGGVGVNNASVVQADLKAANGVVHIIDAVLEKEAFTVADFVKSKRYLSTLATALEVTGLDAALDSETEVTLLAPLDGAFAALPEGTLEALLEDLPALSDILLYHVVGGQATRSDLVDAGGAETLLGPEVEVTVETIRSWWWRYQIIKVNGKLFYATDIETDNGIVHLIGGVLIPPGDEDDES